MPHDAFAPTSTRSLTAALAALLAVAAAAFAAEPEPPPAASVSVRDFGAVGDGETMDTAAIQKAIDAASAAGGGTVVLPPGTYLSGTIVLASDITLHLAAGAVLRGSRDPNDYPEHTPKVEFLYRHRFVKSLLYAEGAENIALTGRGLIDGQGEHFKARSGDDKLRPYLLRFSECRNVRVRDVSFRNSARWLSHYLACENVTIDGITIRSRIRANRDGIGIDSCTDVTVSNCHVYAGDDAIVLKATVPDRPCRRVTVTNCVVSSLASALKLGTESNGGFEDVTISNCAVHDTGYSGIGVMMVDGASLERVTISDITMKDVAGPIFIRLGNRARPMPGGEKPGIGSLRDVTIRNVVADGAAARGCLVAGIPDARVEGVTLENIRIRFRGGGTAELADRDVPEKQGAYPSGKMFGDLPAYGFFCRHAKGLRLRNVELTFDEPDVRPAVVCDDVEDLDVAGLRARLSPKAPAVLRLRNVRGALIRGCRPHQPVPAFLRVEGERSGDIALIANDLRKAACPWTRADGVPRDAVRTDPTPAVPKPRGR